MSIIASGQITISSLNDFTPSKTAPENPYVGQVWQDINLSPPTLKTWDGAKWVDILDDATSEIKNDLLTTIDTVKEVSRLTDANAKKIEDEVWKTSTITVKDTDGNIIEKSLNDLVVGSYLDLSGITQSVSEMSTTLGNPNDDETGISVYSKIAQSQMTADKINWLVKNGTSETNFTLEDRVVSLLSGEFDIDALTTFKNTAISGSETIINGGAIEAESITADKMKITDLSALKATIGLWNITDTKLYSYIPTNSGVFTHYDEETMLVMFEDTCVTELTPPEKYSQFDYESDFVYDGPVFRVYSAKHKYLYKINDKKNTYAHEFTDEKIKFAINADGSFNFASGNLTFDDINGLNLTGGINATSITAKDEYKIYTVGSEEKVIWFEYDDLSDDSNGIYSNLYFGLQRDSLWDSAYISVGQSVGRYTAGEKETYIYLNSDTIFAEGQLAVEDGIYTFGDLELLKNNKKIYGINTSGTAISMLYMNGSNNLVIGDWNTTNFNNLNLNCGSNSVVNMYKGTTNILSVGNGSLTTTENISLSTNGRVIRGANASGTSVNMLQLNSSNNLIVGQNSTNLNNLHLYTSVSGQINLCNDSTIVFSVREDSIGKCIVSAPTYNRTSASAANMYISSNGYMYRSTSSSKRYKKNIVDIEKKDYWAIYYLPLYSFTYKTDEESPGNGLRPDDYWYEEQIPGFVAEKVMEYIPLAVEFNENDEIENYNSKIILPMAVAGIQNNHKEIEELKEETSMLKIELAKALKVIETLTK